MRYTALDQLTSVQITAGGVTQTRTFTWSGLEMISATNPENGTVTYTYNAAHQVTSRTDAKGQVTNYSYDAYGRLEAQAYFVRAPKGWRNSPARPGTIPTTPTPTTPPIPRTPGGGWRP